MVSLLLFLMVSHSLARPLATAFHDVTPMETHHHPEKQQIVNTEDGSCEGLGDEEECMMRRTLQAHLDYIYTQKEKKP